MTGLEQAMQITPSSGLSPEEIERLISEAETSAEKDQEERELIMQRNRLDNMIRNARKAMAEFGRSFPTEEQMEINGILNQAEESVFSEDKDEIALVLGRVEETASRITAAMMTPAV
jgi:molecular chaperone DnaK